MSLLVLMSAAEAVERGAGVGVASVEWVNAASKPFTQPHPWAAITTQALDELGADLLQNTPQDIEEYCPNWSRLSEHGRKAFWVQLLGKLAYLESAHRPEASYTESFFDIHGERVVSRGLLQLSIESSNGNYRCGLADADELHDPATNLRCGVRVMNRLVGQRYRTIAGRKDGKWLGAAAYWSPFRNDAKRAQIAQATSSQAYCVR